MGAFCDTRTIRHRRQKRVRQGQFFAISFSYTYILVRVKKHWFSGGSTLCQTGTVNFFGFVLKGLPDILAC